MNSAALFACPVLQMQGICKRFPGVLALDNVGLTLHSGETLGLIGENGAGKSTLMRILGGDYPADEGEIRFDGRPASITNVQDSISLGVSVIYQELNLAPNLDIASNIFLGREPRLAFPGVVDRSRLYAKAEKLARRVGIAAPMTTLVESLSPGEQQLVEIAKALSKDARILVLDEPTSSLSPAEAGKLFDVMRALKQSGVAMIYISHRLAEVEETCDRAIVLRDGQLAGEIDREHLHPEEMVKLMIGRDISRFFPEHHETDETAPVLSVEDMSYVGGKSPVTFELKPGEILGVAGLVGSGRTELVQALFGIEPKLGGIVRIRGEVVEIRTPADAIRVGMGLVPEDRKALGVILEMPVVENISLSSIGSYRPPFMDRAREARVATELGERLDIKTPSLTQLVQYLSGGNQQKVALAKWLATNPGILILDEPTRGIDVGSKSEIYKLIRQLADEGMGVIMVSSEMEEIIGLADRVLVMHEGRCTGILGRHEVDEQSIMQLATGGNRA